MEIEQANETYQTDIDRLRAAIDKSRQLRAMWERRNDPSEPVAPPAKPHDQRAPTHIEPTAYLHRLLRRVAYVSSDSRATDHNQAAQILERAILYRSKGVRHVTCRRCGGDGEINLDATKKQLAAWMVGYKVACAEGHGEDYDERYPIPEPDTCPRCKGAGVHLGESSENISARPTGSSKHGSVAEFDPNGVMVLARAGRIVRRVAEASKLHAYALEAYYGDKFSVPSIAMAHGRLSLLFPLTETGGELLRGFDGANPFDYVAQHVARADVESQALVLSMTTEAYALLVDATETWNQSVTIEAPDWMDGDE